MVSLGEGVLITPARLLLGVWPRIALAGARSSVRGVLFVEKATPPNRSLQVARLLVMMTSAGTAAFMATKRFICKAQLSLCLLSVV